MAGDIVAGMTPVAVLPAAAVKAAARSSGFPLVGLARAQPLDPAPLDRWLAAGYAADMHWMADRREERLDPGRVLEGARTVLALAIPYGRAPDPPEGRKGKSAVAHYARGRDYHYAHRDRLKALRKRLLRLDPTLETYACVDTGVAMEKPWAERAGLGWIGKNGCLITPEHGSWVTLSVMFLDREVDAHDEQQPNLCGECTRCLTACPTSAFPSPGVVDARRCISYQTIENQGFVPLPLRGRLRGHLFGCDVCQEVCPFNRGDLPPGDPRFAPRPIGLMREEEIAALSREAYERLSAGSALARAKYDGLRRNAILALGPARAREARALLERLAQDPSPIVRDAARWALESSVTCGP
jgi:epoxyqueuosine reductase